MYESREMDIRQVFEKVKCSKCGQGVHFTFCQATGSYDSCYSEYLEEQNKQMLEALIETYLSIDSPIRVMDKSAVRKLIEKVTQKKIEEI